MFTCAGAGNCTVRAVRSLWVKFTEKPDAVFPGRTTRQNLAVLSRFILKISSPMRPRHYNAFISYSHTDCGTIAPQVQKAIENLGKPWYWIEKKRLHVFRDETNLSANPGFWDVIVSALRNSDYLILLASS